MSHVASLVAFQHPRGSFSCPQQRFKARRTPQAPTSDEGAEALSTLDLPLPGFAGVAASE